jgi:hypothetical protein
VLDVIMLCLLWLTMVLLLLRLVAHPSTPGSLTRAKLRYLQAIGGQCGYLGITVLLIVLLLLLCCCSA